MSATTDEIDLQAPFIAKDGLEYGCFADFLIGEPLHTWRNEQIQALRSSGRSEALVREWIKGFDGEALVREWIKGFDGEEARPSATLTGEEHGRAASRALVATDAFYRPRASYTFYTAT